MTFTRTKRIGTFLVLLLATVCLGFRDTSARKFDSAEWKAGSATTRGLMTQDLMDRNLLIGKAPAEVEGLLGKPDSHDPYGYDYKVVTIARCYMWRCRLEVLVDHSSRLVTSVAVSD